MRDVLGKMRECGKYVKMRDFPHDCGMVDTYELRLPVQNLFTCPFRVPVTCSCRRVELIGPNL